MAGKRGKCSHCGRPVAIRQDGRTFGHGGRRSGPGDDWCPGAGELPVQTPVPWSEQARREPPPLPITARPDLAAFRVFDGLLNHFTDPRQVGHFVADVSGGVSVAELVELATTHTCKEPTDDPR